MDSDDWSADDEGNDARAEKTNKRKTNPSTPVKKKRSRGEMSKQEKEEAQGPKRFQSSWLTDEEFKAWVKPVDGDITKAVCKVCNSGPLVAGKSELQKHASGKKHKKRMESIKNLVPITAAINRPNAEMILAKKVKCAEIGLAAYFAEHNIAVQNSDHLVDTLKSNITDSEIVKKISMDRTKCTALLKNVLGKTEQEELVAVLNTVKFSVLVDESTDTGNKKNMVVLTRYTDPKSGMIQRLTSISILEARARALLIFTFCYY